MRIKVLRPDPLGRRSGAVRRDGQSRRESPSPDLSAISYVPGCGLSLVKDDFLGVCRFFAKMGKAWGGMIDLVRRGARSPYIGRLERGGDRSMEHVEFDPHLSEMSTQWAVVFKAHSPDPDEAHIAASQLMCRYAGAVHRYLLKALKDPHAADELDQEFALRFLRGDFRNSDPNRGRFRDYVKRAVQNLINDHYRRKRPNVSLDARTPEPAIADGGVAEFEQQFIESWRKDLLDRAWNCAGRSREKHRQTLSHHTSVQGRSSRPAIGGARGQALDKAEEAAHRRSGASDVAAFSPQIRRLSAERGQSQPRTPHARRSRAGACRLELAPLLPPVHEQERWSSLSIVGRQFSCALVT